MLLKMQIPGLHPRPPESQSLGTEPEILPLNKPTWHSLCGSRCFCFYPYFLESATVGSYVGLWEFREWPVSYIHELKPEEFAPPACQKTMKIQGTKEQEKSLRAPEFAVQKEHSVQSLRRWNILSRQRPWAFPAWSWSFKMDGSVIFRKCPGWLCWTVKFESHNLRPCISVPVSSAER